MSNQPANQMTASKPQRFRALLEDHVQSKALKVLGAIDAARLMELFAVEAARTPAIYDCAIENPTSVAGVYMLAANLGLTIGSARGEIYPIPRRMDQRMTLTALVGFRGFTRMVRRSPDVARMNAGVVYAEEIERGYFTWTNEPPDAVHRGGPLERAKTEAELMYAYCLIEMKNGAKYVEVMDRGQVMKRRAVAQSKKVWDKWPAEMWQKTAIRKLMNSGLVPLTDSLSEAVAFENERDFVDVQPVTVEQVANPTPEPDLIRERLGLTPDPEPAPIEEDPSAQLRAEITEFEEALNEAGIHEAVAATGFPDPASNYMPPEVLQKYRDELAKRVGGE